MFFFLHESGHVLGYESVVSRDQFPPPYLRLSRDELEIKQGLRGLVGIFFLFCEILMKTENAVFLWPLLCKVACPFLCQHATFKVVGVWGKEKVVQHKQLSM